MPQQQALPTWLSLNNVNSVSQSGMIDPVTGFPYVGGGLNLGDYFDLTEQEANQLSYPTNGLLHAGRYRYVQVDSGATAGLVAATKVGFVRTGTFVQSAIQSVAGSGMTVGATVTATTTGGGGTTQATIQVVVLTATTVAITVLTTGSGFTSIPTVTITGTGGTPPSVIIQLNSTVNTVTSSDVANTSLTLVRPVVFLNSITPGNYGFVQELGIANTLASGAITANNFVSAVAATATVTGGTTFTVLTIGQAIDTGVSGQILKVLLSTPVVQD